MISNEIDEKKTKYFVIAIMLLIVLSVILIIHFNNKSLVSGEEENTTTTTTTTTSDIIKIEENKKTTKKTNIKKENVEETVVETLEQENVIYKSTIDETNKLIYNYKLTEEINDKDIIVSKILTIEENLKNNNIIGLYDISLYDEFMVKKNVTNSSIDISIPMTSELIGYDEYKIVYIDDNNLITNEEFKHTIENGYIKFTTTHLSKFGIIGIKKEIVEEEKQEEPKEEVEIIDLTNVSLDIKINDETITDLSSLYIETTDKLDVVVKNLDKEYKLYYLLKDEEGLNTYQEFNNNIFETIKTPSKYTLFIKIDVNGITKTFEICDLNIYDIVFTYDKEEVLDSDIELGTIKDENGVESTYVDINNNKNIVIDTIETEELKEEIVQEDAKEVLPENSEEEIVTETNSEKAESTEDTDEKTNSDENQNETTEEEPTEEKEDLATINLKGNIYLVEKTDITNLEITGHLIIDTDDDIVYDEEKLGNIYSIIIKSKEFSLNGNKYTYEYTKDGLVITKLEETISEFNDLFNNYEYDVLKEELILIKKQQCDINGPEVPKVPEEPETSEPENSEKIVIR